MKKFIALLFIVLHLYSFSINYTSTQGGQWDNANTWNQTSYPDNSLDNVDIDNNDSIWLPGTGVGYECATLVFNQNSILYIPEGDTLYCDSISVLNNAIFHINGALIVNGGFSMSNNSSLDIDLEGDISIGGDFDASNNTDINVDGSMNVEGDFTAGNGTDITGDGDVTVEGEVDIPDGSDPGVVINDGLPIELLEFKVQKINNSVIIEWITSSEINNDYFLLERSNNTKNWLEVTKIKGQGNSSTIQYYRYHDQILADITYYRLTQFDYDGKSETFKLISLMNITDYTKYDVKVYTYNGKFVSSYKRNFNESTLSSGLYILQLTHDDTQIIQKLLVD